MFITSTANEKVDMMSLFGFCQLEYVDLIGL